MADYKDYYDSHRITRPVRIPPETIARLRKELDMLESDEVLVWKAAYFITNERNFENWAGRQGLPTTVEGLGTVKVLDVKQDERSDSYGGGEYAMGSTADASITFQVTFSDGREVFLRKEGSYDSYGEVSYSSGAFRQVTPKQKTITVYEW